MNLKTMLYSLDVSASGASEQTQPQKRNLNLSAFCLAIVIGLVTASLSKAEVVFDNMSNYEGGDASAHITTTGSTPNTFMGDGYILKAGTINITGFDIFPANLSGTTFTGLKITIYVWGSVNTGTVNAGTPAFGNLLASYTTTVSGNFVSGSYYPFESFPVGSAPGIQLGTPLAISGTNIGISISYQGTTDGVNYGTVNSLTSLISYGTAPSVGSQQFNGYFRNANSEVNGNFTSSLRTLGLTFQSLALRVYGTVQLLSNLPPVATAQSITIAKNTSANITLAATDPNNDPLTYSVVTAPANGTLTGSAPNLVYTPNANYSGPDAFTFKANDGQTDSVPATVSITVLSGSAGLIINPIWDATILNDPNVAAITNTINTAILTLESRFSNPVTVSILFAEMNTGLGQSSTYIATAPYSSYYAALAAGSTITNDVMALAHIAGGASNPVNGGASITCALPLFRALGFNANPPSGQPDSTVSLNMSLINITRTSINPSKYDLQAVVTHEMDEVLGASSGVNRANIFPVDLFRYTAAGSRSYTTAGDDAYFSIDGGATDLVRYNQNSGGDYGDFWSVTTHSPVRVQDAFGTPGATPDLGVEFTILDVIGWDLVTPTSTTAPVFQSVSQAGGIISFNWSSVSGQNYQVQYKKNLTDSVWLNLGNIITATSSITSATDLIGPDSQRFYQVELLSGPSASISVAKQSNLKLKKNITGPLELRKHIHKPKADDGRKPIQSQPHQIFPSVHHETIGGK
jgi:hypothetical protein